MNDTPTPQAIPTDWIRRRAKLFEAGEYPDKGMSVTPEDLARLAASFSNPVPILIEHAASPLDLGSLESVEAVGGELFGSVRLTPEANELIEKSGAFALSIGLSPSLDSIKEISLVRRPRVPDARLFSGDVRLQRHDPLGMIQSWLEKGLLVPAQLDYALALAETCHAARFREGEAPVWALLKGLIESAPARRLFAQEAPSAASPNPSLAPEAADFYRRHFPDLSLEEIVRRCAD